MCLDKYWCVFCPLKSRIPVESKCWLSLLQIQGCLIRHTSDAALMSYEVIVNGHFWFWSQANWNPSFASQGKPRLLFLPVLNQGPAVWKGDAHIWRASSSLSISRLKITSRTFLAGSPLSNMESVEDDMMHRIHLPSGMQDLFPWSCKEIQLVRGHSSI